MRTVPLGLDNIVLPSDATRRRTFEAANQTLHAGGDSSRHKWRVGELEFEALMRRLENAVSCRSSQWQSLTCFCLQFCHICHCCQLRILLVVDSVT